MDQIQIMKINIEPGLFHTNEMMNGAIQKPIGAPIIRPAIKKPIIFQSVFLVNNAIRVMIMAIKTATTAVTIKSILSSTGAE